MKIYSWHLHGIRAHKDGFLDWLYGEQPDVLVLQRTRARPEQLDEELRQPEGYLAWWNGPDNQYISGTGLLSKVEPLDVQFSIGIHEVDRKARTVIAEFDQFTLMICHFEFYDYWWPIARTLVSLANESVAKGKPVILGGDLRVTDRAIDTASAKRRLNVENRYSNVDWFRDEGYIDIFRRLHPDRTDIYTYWNNAQRREQNIGDRWHMFLISPDLTENVASAKIHDYVQLDPMQCPISVELSFDTVTPGVEADDAPESEIIPPVDHSPRQPEEDDGSGYVYLIQDSVCTGTYKIGHTNDIPTRFNTLDIKLPFEIELIHTIATPDRRSLEKSLHARYKNEHVNGEWFSLSGEQVAEILQM